MLIKDFRGMSEEQLIKYIIELEKENQNLGERLGKLSSELVGFTTEKIKEYSDEYKSGFMECKAWIKQEINKILMEKSEHKED